MHSPGWYLVHQGIHSPRMSVVNHFIHPDTRILSQTSLFPSFPSPSPWSHPPNRSFNSQSFHPPAHTDTQWNIRVSTLPSSVSSSTLPSVSCSHSPTQKHIHLVIYSTHETSTTQSPTLFTPLIIFHSNIHLLTLIYTSIYPSFTLTPTSPLHILTLHVPTSPPFHILTLQVPNSPPLPPPFHRVHFPDNEVLSRQPIQALIW